MMKTILVYEVKELTKIYPGPKPVVANDHLSLAVEEGKIVGIFGPNGAGKTTLIRQLIGLLRPTSGTIKLLGHDILRDPSVATRYVAYFAQDTYYFWHLNPQELLIITGCLRGLNLKEAKRQTQVLLERFGLEKLARRPLARLSFGQARFVTLLSVFMAKRPVLVLDEPTNDLDPMHRKMFWDFLWEMNSCEGTTVVLVTHNIYEAEHVVHQVAIIDKGRLVAFGFPDELKKKVEKQMRMEIVLSESSTVQYENLVFANAEKLPAKRGMIRLQVSQKDMNKILQEVYEKIPASEIKDLRFVSPTLEDVYMHVVGKQWEE